MAQVTVHYAKTNLSKLIAEVLAGGEVVIARGKEPAVRLVPAVPATPKRMPGRWKGKLNVPDAFFAPLTDEELSDWHGTDR